MNEYVQITCPADGSQQALQLEETTEGSSRVVWCSRTVGCPDCDQSCLRQLKTVRCLMVTELPGLEQGELSTLSVDSVLERFEDTPLERLPVLKGQRLVGSLSLSALAGWRDCDKTSRSLRMKEWESVPSAQGLAELMELEHEFLSPADSWAEAAAYLLRHHRNEAFVVDTEGRFVGAVYARQILRAVLENTKL